MACDLNDRFSDLKDIDFPSWITLPVLVDLTVVAMQYEEELSEMRNDASIRTLFNIKRTMAWLCEETETKYPKSTSSAKNYCCPSRRHIQLNVALVL
jgi:hypothetical protein